ncbi:hypothetical protein AYO44_15170 [Planctomycetaceae bacterium SCGC AG-212-F19]|nr:hypothetical protein AYO44_15170 [Planctomycetaceae bacterium SCGC AG-212-F19]
MKLPVCLLSVVALVCPFLARGPARPPARPRDSRPMLYFPFAFVPWEPPPGEPASGGTVEPPPVSNPEPSTLVLAGIGASMLAGGWLKLRGRRTTTPTDVK